MEKVTRAKKEEEKVVYWVGPKSSLTLNPKLKKKKTLKKETQSTIWKEKQEKIRVAPKKQLINKKITPWQKVLH
jgi:hypothetical protein